MCSRHQPIMAMRSLKILTVHSACVLSSDDERVTCTPELLNGLACNCKNNSVMISVRVSTKKHDEQPFIGTEFV